MVARRIDRRSRLGRTRARCELSRSRQAKAGPVVEGERGGPRARRSRRSCAVDRQSSGSRGCRPGHRGLRITRAIRNSSRHRRSHRAAGEPGSRCTPSVGDIRLGLARPAPAPEGRRRTAGRPRGCDTDRIRHDGRRPTQRGSPPTRSGADRPRPDGRASSRCGHRRRSRPRDDGGGRGESRDRSRLLHGDRGRPICGSAGDAGPA